MKKYRKQFILLIAILILVFFGPDLFGYSNGYASELLYLEPHEAGQFVFRGMNANEEVIVVD